MSSYRDPAYALATIEMMRWAGGQLQQLQQQQLQQATADAAAAKQLQETTAAEMQHVREELERVKMESRMKINELTRKLAESEAEKRKLTASLQLSDPWTPNDPDFNSNTSFFEELVREVEEIDYHPRTLFELDNECVHEHFVGSWRLITTPSPVDYHQVTLEPSGPGKWLMSSVSPGVHHVINFELDRETEGHVFKDLVVSSLFTIAGGNTLQQRVRGLEGGEYTVERVVHGNHLIVEQNSGTGPISAVFERM